MLKDKLYSYITTYFADYFFEIDKSQLQLAVLSGAINLTHLKISPRKFNALLPPQLPLLVRAGIIGTLQLKVSWFSVTL